MGLLDKVKNLFTEEIEEEEMPVRKEMKRVEITPPRAEPIRPEMPRQREETKITEIKREEPIPISDSSVLNKDEKFKFPVYFDDKDFDDLPKPKPKEKPVFKPESRPAYQGSKALDDTIDMVTGKPKKKFKVSPVISPVYGVLDKNYNKDDIRVKSEKTIKKFHYEEKLTVDDIRNKAYGTLEDDLEHTLLAKPVEKENPVHIDTGIDIFEEVQNTETTVKNDLLMNDIVFENNHPQEEKVSDISNVALEEELEKQKQKIDELSKYINSIQSEAEVLEPVTTPKEENIIEEVVQDDKIEEISDEKENIKSDDGDLFSLIDSMYEKRED